MPHGVDILGIFQIPKGDLRPETYFSGGKIYMPIICEFSYLKPKKLKEALKLLSKPGSRILSGGTDLIVKLKEDMERPKTVIDIKGIKTLSELKFKKNTLSIGSLVTFSDLIDSKMIRDKFPLLSEMCATVASKGVRNRATIAGNICSAVPSADSSAVLQVYDAEVLVESLKKKRRISVNEWFKGPKKTALKPDEIVTSIEIKLPKIKHAGYYAKLSRYEGEDLAQAGIAVLAFSGDTYKIAACALGPKPLRAYKAEKILNGNKLSETLLAEVKKTLLTEISPIGDIRSSREYRLHMARIMIERALKAAVSRLAGKGPKYGEKVV